MNLDQINDAPDILMEFLEYHSTVRGHSDKTVAGYYLDLKILFRFIKRIRHLVSRDVPFNEIDILDVDIDFIKTIRIEELYRYQSFSPELQGSNRSLSAASRCRRISATVFSSRSLRLRPPPCGRGGRSCPSSRRAAEANLRRQGRL